MSSFSITLNTGHPIDIAHSSLELLSDPPTAASQAAGITGARHHTKAVSIYRLKNGTVQLLWYCATFQKHIVCLFVPSEVANMSFPRELWRR
uniref:Uncharacterized protein n=1 Tax=Chelydra serpentina TaxID=8475 RepID=A0A8C3RSC6_CHESE